MCPVSLVNLLSSFFLSTDYLLWCGGENHDTAPWTGSYTYHEIPFLNLESPSRLFMSVATS